MNVRIPRRAVLGLGPLTFASCTRLEPYFGKSTPPRSQTLIYDLGGEPSGLDPATALGGTEGDVLPGSERAAVVAPPGFHGTCGRAGYAL